MLPVSAVILDQVKEYRKTLEHYSKHKLELINWIATAINNVEVLNGTIDLYRYFDVAVQIESFFECIDETVTTFKYLLYENCCDKEDQHFVTQQEYQRPQGSLLSVEIPYFYQILTYRHHEHVFVHENRMNLQIHPRRTAPLRNTSTNKPVTFNCEQPLKYVV